MRTVSFSEPEVQQLLDQEFLCSTENIRGQANAGASFSHRPKDPPGICVRGNGKQNVQLYFLTPAGEIFHVVTGYISGPEMVIELKFALDTFRELRQLSSLEERKSKLIELHKLALKDMEFSDEEIEQGANGPLVNRALARFNPAQLGQDVNRFLSDPEQFRRDLRKMSEDRAAVVDQALKLMSRREILSDHRYCIDHPLVSHKEFKPEELVGIGTSFFGSTSFGQRQ